MLFCGCGRSLAMVEGMKGRYKEGGWASSGSGILQLFFLSMLYCGRVCSGAQWSREGNHIAIYFHALSVMIVVVD